MRAMINWNTALRGGLIYASGDSIATLITGDFLAQRALGVFTLGASLYAAEISAYFGWLDRRFGGPGLGNALKKAALAQAFFNPVWIARHLAFLKLCSARWADIDWRLLSLGMESFLHILPIGLLVNFLIQNSVPLHWRFLASASYSALTAVYLALSEVLFG